jgi:hypothetical protein
MGRLSGIIVDVFYDFFTSIARRTWARKRVVDAFSVGLRLGWCRAGAGDFRRRLLTNVEELPSH